MTAIVDAWLRRNWRRRDADLARFASLEPAAVVTGASEGIGLELARLLARRRSDIVLIARTSVDLAAAAKALQAAARQSPPPNIHTLALDISRPDAAETIAAELTSKNLYVDELINSAGIGLSGNFGEHDPAELDRLVELNVTALSRLTRAVLPDMLARGRGGIINIASLGGFTPGPYQAAYYASKAYVISLTRALAHENRGMGVRFAVVAPGPVETRFHARMDAERAFYRRFLPALSPARVARATMFWYALGSTVIVPGVFNTVLALALGFLPGLLTIPVVALLLHPRDVERDA